MTQEILEYHSIIRKDAISLLGGGKFDQALEIGCGTGNTLGFLKEKNIIKHATGVELNSECLKFKNQLVDAYFIGNAEEFDFSTKKYDLIILLDVIEHLADPWGFLKKITNNLNSKGKLLVSIPNINNIRILKKLILNDRWDYSDSGILDRTHLRFFTETSFVLQIKQELPNLKIVGVGKNYEEIKLLTWLKMIPFFKKFMACQLLFNIEKQ